ncbi:MAG: hypothetical protein ACRD3N_06385 [Terracidiphilus sp.]
MMLKSLTYAALLLAFVQVPPGAAAQAVGPSGPALQGQPPSSTAAQPNPAGATAPPNCPGGVCDEQPQQITVANPAPATAPIWPMHERIAWAAGLVLVVLAYVGIMLALSTLRKIERAMRNGEKVAAAAADSAQAALLYAQSLVEAERPWILVSADPARTVENGFAIVARNQGRTPARIVAIDNQTAFAADEARLPDPPHYDEEKAGASFAPVILLPGESTEIKTFSRGEVKELCQSEDRLKKVESWDEKIFFYGKVTYRDLIAPRDEQIHETAWCCWYIHGRQRSGMVAAGPREYNSHT